MRRRTFIALGCASAMSRTATAQAPWPSRPVHIICGFSVGTTTDLLARLLADRLGERLQRPVVVEQVWPSLLLQAPVASQVPAHRPVGSAWFFAAPQAWVVVLQAMQLPVQSVSLQQAPVAMQVVVPPSVQDCGAVVGQE